MKRSTARLPRGHGPRSPLLWGTALALAAGSAACPGSQTPRGPLARPAEAPRARAPIEAHFEDLRGQDVSLARFRGKPLVILFFTTWCVPCQITVAHLQRVRAALGNTRVAVLGVSIDTERRLVPTFVEAAGFNFPVVYGSPALVRKGPFGPIRGVPRLLVLSPAGHLVADEQKPPTARRLLDILRPWVRR